ncbi:MAG: Iron-sulfur assembly protein 1 [Bogoriella megaspora]|nr:MAG: Iron-sulfur assembly protein 1 [Bogoriella megaspora]
MLFARATTSSATAALKTAAPRASRAQPYRCPQCLRNFSSSRAFYLSARRQLQTATAHRPSNLEPPPPPPRNTGIPDTSIAGGVPESDQTRPPRLTEERRTSPQSATDQTSSVSIPEGEAQKPKPASTTSSPMSTAPPEPSLTSSKPKRPRLKPRKAAMNLTSTAVTQLRELLDQPEPKLIRVGVKNRGCSGLAYHLEYVDKAGKFDEAVEQDGVKVLIDSKALFSIIGSEMDWVEDKLNQRFVFRNPNISESLCNPF